MTLLTDQPADVPDPEWYEALNLRYNAWVYIAPLSTGRFVLFDRQWNVRSIVDLIQILEAIGTKPEPRPEPTHLDGDLENILSDLLGDF